MTLKQRVLKILYPLIMRVSGSNKEQVRENTDHKLPLFPFYSLPAEANNGSRVDFAGFRGKKILLVNTASECGYTGQYDELEKLYSRYKDRLVVLGFPANDFKEQEKGTDEEIAEFCRVNFGVSFPLFKKSRVVRGEGQNPVFQWLTDKTKNGWNDQEPVWNFCKYLVDENGTLTHFFAMNVSPLAPAVIRAIEA